MPQRDGAVPAEVRLNLDLATQYLGNEVDHLCRPRSVFRFTRRRMVEMFMCVTRSDDAVTVAHGGPNRPVVAISVHQLNLYALLVELRRALCGSTRVGFKSASIRRTSS